MHTHRLHIQAIAREDTGLFGEPERQDTRRVGNVRGGDFDWLRTRGHRKRAEPTEREEGKEPAADLHRQTSHQMIEKIAEAMDRRQWRSNPESFETFK